MRVPGPQQHVARRSALVFTVLCLLILVVFLAVIEQDLSRSGRATAVLAGLQTVGFQVGPSEAVGLLVLSTVVGIFGGMLGMGGGVLQMASLLLLYQMDIYLARTVTVITMFFVASSAIFRQHLLVKYLPGSGRVSGERVAPHGEASTFSTLSERARGIDPCRPRHREEKDGRFLSRTIVPMVIPALIGVVGGVLLGFRLRGPTLTHIFGFFVIFLALYTLAMVLGDPDESLIRRSRQQREGQGQLGRLLGVMHGFFCGLLGISGGVVTTPMQQIFLSIPVHRAISVSLVLTAICCGLSAVVMVGMGLDRGDFSADQITMVAVFVGIGALIGGQLGVKLGQKVNAGVLRLVFVAAALIAGLSIVF